MAALLAAFLLSGCASDRTTPLPPTSGPALRIVSSLPFKGPDGAQSNLMRHAIDLAIDEAGPQVPGLKLEHLALDGGDRESGEPTGEIEAANARAAAGDPSLVAYIGPYTSGAAMTSIPILNGAGLLQVLPVATWPGLTQPGWAAGEPGRYYPARTQTLLRLMPPDSSQAQVAARKAKQLGASSALILADPSDYGSGMAASFRDEARQVGITVTGIADPDAGGPNLGARIGGADIVFVAVSNLATAARAAGALAKHKPRLGVIATDVLLSDRVPQQVLDQMQGWYVVWNGDLTPGDPAPFGAFSSEFSTRFGLQPSQYAANCYDVTLALIEAVARGAVDRKSVLEAVPAGTYQGSIQGKLSFRSNGDVQGGALSLYRVQGGVFEFQEELSLP